MLRTNYLFLLDWGDFLIDSQDNIQAGISGAVDNLWTSLLISDLWNRDVALSVGVFALCMGVFVVQWMKSILDGEFTPDKLMPLIIVFALGLFLAQNGAGARGLALASRGLINQFNAAVLALNIQGGVSLQSAYSNAINETQVNLIFQQQLQECNENYSDDPPARSLCFQQALENANEKAANLGLDNTFITQLNQVNQTLSDLSPTKYVTNWVINSTVIAFLAIINAAFQWMLEVTWLLSTFLLPISLAFSVFPLGGQRPVVLWLISFWSIGFCKFCFNLLNGIVALLLSGQNNSANGVSSELLLAFMIGIFSPILAFALASGGAKSVFEAMASFSSSIATSAIGMSVGALTGGVGGALAVKMSSHSSTPENPESISSRESRV